MRTLLLAVLIVSFAGCTAAKQQPRQSKSIRLSQLEQGLIQRDEAIEQYRQALQQLETQIKEKDEKIAELRKKLETFGVFEK